MTANQYRPYEPYTYTPQPLTDAEVMAYAAQRRRPPMPTLTTNDMEFYRSVGTFLIEETTSMTTEEFDPVTVEEFRAAAIAEAEKFKAETAQDDAAPTGLPPVTGEPSEAVSAAPEEDSGEDEQNPNREAARYRTRLRDAEARIAELESGNASRAMTDALSEVLPRHGAVTVDDVIAALPEGVTTEAAVSLVKVIGEAHRNPLLTKPVEALHSGAGPVGGPAYYGNVSQASEIERHMW
ncbi:hypothetical protein [Actinorhabdospora filicis]|uniref:hypothetical protein n=1 Tax=Actinorhabdospora filicis TaxID=1785913 RepID=UPI002554ADC7|nr:hypothetical protein [Actinorhabdospora filicis]